VKDHARLCIVFLVSRALLYVAGLRMHLELGWMFLSDPEDLRERLLETVYYFHAYPPGMNLLTGWLLKAAPGHIEGLAQALFSASGLVLVNALFFLCRSVLSRRPALVVCVAFAVIPQSLFFEHLYLYTELETSLLCLVCAWFLHASRRGSGASWFGLFFVCAVIGWLRSSFHLVWFLTAVALSAWFNPAQRRRIALAALAPAVLLCALYLKNWAVFGVFASSSSLGGNLAHVTVARMPKAERAEWQRQGRLSPYADISVFAGPERYARFFHERRLEGVPDVVNRLDRPSVKAPNYNHWWLREVNRARRSDAAAYLREHALAYLGTVAHNVVALFSPSTTWHPIQGEQNPHARHRLVLGNYELVYNGLVHELFFAPVGFYAFFPLLFGLSLWRSVIWARAARGRVAARVSTIRFAAFQVLYLAVVSCFVTYSEMSRYRYTVEPLIWFLAAVGIASLGRPRNWQRRWAAWSSRRRAEALPEGLEKRSALEGHS
jgi:hypothetical protein